MARIRSVHPSMFTDEAFMSLSAHARILMIGLWCEADDQGVFEWKPLTLKARLLPADNIDIKTLLDELAVHNVIRHYEVGGKAYGAIRNFRKFQRPEKPKTTYPLVDGIASYVALATTTHSGSDKIPGPIGEASPTTAPPRLVKSSTPQGSVADRSPTPPRKSGQMEDGGGNRKEKEDSCPKPDADAPDRTSLPDREKVSNGDPPSASPRKRNEYPAKFELFWQGYPTDPNMSKAEAFAAWKRLPLEDQDLAIASLPAHAAWLKRQPSDHRVIHAVRYLAKERFRGFAEQAAKAGLAGEEDNWRTKLDQWKQGRWHAAWGDPPKTPGCNIPIAFVEDWERKNAPQQAVA